MERSPPLLGRSVSGVSLGQLILARVFASGSHVPESCGVTHPIHRITVKGGRGGGGKGNCRGVKGTLGACGCCYKISLCEWAAGEASCRQVSWSLGIDRVKGAAATCRPREGQQQGEGPLRVLIDGEGAWGVRVTVYTK